MLVVVPTLAGTWPAVRSVVNRFDTAAASLSSSIDNDLQEVNRRLIEIQSKFERAENDNPLAPEIQHVSITVNKIEEAIQKPRTEKILWVSLLTPKLRLYGDRHFSPLSLPA